MSKTVNMHEAKTNLSRLVAQIRTGEEREIVIAVSGRPYARLVAYDPPKAREFGIDRGLIVIGDDFDAADAEIERLFTGEYLR